MNILNVMLQLACVRSFRCVGIRTRALCKQDKDKKLMLQIDWKKLDDGRLLALWRNRT